MTSSWTRTSALQKIKVISMPGAGKYKRRTNFLSNRERDNVVTPRASGKGAYQLKNAEGESNENEKRMQAARGTHFLESPDGKTERQIRTQRMQVSKGHSHPGQPRQRDKSEHRMNASQQGALTFRRA